MMNRAKIIIVVCEGASEWAYIQALNSFIESLPFQDGCYDAPIHFVGKPKKQVLAKVRTRQQRKSFAKSQRANERRKRGFGSMPISTFETINHAAPFTKTAQEAFRRFTSRSSTLRTSSRFTCAMPTSNGGSM